MKAIRILGAIIWTTLLVASIGSLFYLYGKCVVWKNIHRLCRATMPYEETVEVWLPDNYASVSVDSAEEKACDLTDGKYTSVSLETFRALSADLNISVATTFKKDVTLLYYGVKNGVGFSAKQVFKKAKYSGYLEPAVPTLYVHDGLFNIRWVAEANSAEKKAIMGETILVSLVGGIMTLMLSIMLGIFVFIPLNPYVSGWPRRWKLRTSFYH